MTLVAPDDTRLGLEVATSTRQVGTSRETEAAAGPGVEMTKTERARTRSPFGLAVICPRGVVIGVG
jgi:hypothetical protein